MSRSGTVAQHFFGEEFAKKYQFQGPNKGEHMVLKSRITAAPFQSSAGSKSSRASRQQVKNRELGVRYSTSGLAISANRLAIRPPAKTADGAREARPRCFVDEGVVLLSDLR